ncbi:short-chain dehydrogenase, partial [Rhodococcus sp. IITR03]
PRRREYCRASTAATLAANALAPGLLDRYLARTGYRSQQTDRPRDPDQPINLWQPADGPEGTDFGAHGEFDDRAKASSVQAWLSRHHGLLAASVTGALTATGMALAARTRTT